jgi:hypothetical protein
MDDDDDWDFDDLDACEPIADASSPSLQTRETHTACNGTGKGSSFIFGVRADSADDDDWLNSGTAETNEAVSEMQRAGTPFF